MKQGSAKRAPGGQVGPSAPQFHLLLGPCSQLRHMCRLCHPVQAAVLCLAAQTTLSNEAQHEAKTQHPQTRIKL